MSAHCGLSRHKNFVIRLSLIADHAHLVGLSMIDVDVYCLLKGERLEVRPAVIDVDHRMKVCAVIHCHQHFVPRDEENL